MFTIGDVVLGPVSNGIHVYAWKASRFGVGQPRRHYDPTGLGLPDAGPVVTSDEFGSIGAFRIEVPTDEDYFIETLSEDGTNWMGPYRAGSSQGFVSPMTTEGDLIIGSSPGADLALAMGVIAAADDAYLPAANAIDNDDATCWEHNTTFNGNFGNWLRLDLGTPAVVDHVRIFQVDHYPFVNTLGEYTLQATNDVTFTTWVDLVTGKGRLVDDDTFPTGSTTPYRYWRILGTDHTRGENFSILTFSLFAGAAGSPVRLPYIGDGNVYGGVAGAPALSPIAFGTGAPSNGDGRADGTVYIRQDGVAGSMIYTKAAGVYTAVL